VVILKAEQTSKRACFIVLNPIKRLTIKFINILQPKHSAAVEKPFFKALKNCEQKNLFFLEFK
jgi:hypothetical protein